LTKRKWTNEEIQEYRKKKGAFLYYNREDSNILVPKAFGIGWTVNWANPISWIFILAILVFIFSRKFY